MVLPLRCVIERRTTELGVGPTVAARKRGGKSGLLRVGRQVTPGRREPTESATENTPPMVSGNGHTGKVEMVR